MSHLTTHVLDTALGRPAAGVAVRLERVDGDTTHTTTHTTPHTIATATTDADGRVGDLGPERLEPGTHRLVFDVAGYAAASGQDCFFPEVALTFTVGDDPHYHVPLLLSPFAYSTYRGS